MNQVAELPELNFAVADDAIDAMRAEYMPLKIAGVEDKSGYEIVRAARITVKNKRCEVEKARKALKADALEYGRKVDTEAKRITALLEPIEAHLADEEEAYYIAKDEIRKAEEQKKQAALQVRLDALAAVGAMRHPSVIDILTDEEFADTLADCTREFEEKKAKEAAEAAEKARQEEELRKESERVALERAELERIKARHEAEAAEARRKEDERLAAERIELEKQRREQAEAQAKIDAENKRIADEEAERKRQAELELAKSQAAEQAKRDAEEKAKRDAAEAKAREVAEAAERKRIESLRPDHEKLLAFADQLAAVEFPKVSAAAADVAGEAKMLRTSVVTRIRAAANMLVKSE